MFWKINKKIIFDFGIGGCALWGGFWLWFSLFKYFEKFFCWPPAWELLWSWILMSSGVNTHCDPPLVLFQTLFPLIGFSKSFHPWDRHRVLHFLWKIKLCNLLLDPSEPTPPSLSLFIDSTALQWEKNSQADGLAQKNIKKRFTADIKNSNVATQTSVQKGTWWKLRVSSPSLGLLPWPRPLIKVLLSGFHRCVLTLLTLQSIFQQSMCASDPILNTFIVWTSTLLLLSESHFALWSTPTQ